MNILYVAARYQPHLGGTELHTSEVASEMVKRGHNVTVLTTDLSSKLPIRESSPGLEVFRIPAYPTDRDYYFAPHARDIVRSKGFDLVHIQGYHTALAPMALRWLRGSKTPVVLTFHSGGARNRLRQAIRPIQHRVLSHYLPKNTVLVAVSQFERAMLAHAFDIPPSSIQLIKNGVSSGIFVEDERIQRTPGLIVSAGRLERYKGHHLGIAAMPQVLRKVPEAHLVVAGSGPYKSNLQRLVEEHGVQSHVTFKSIPQNDRSAMGRLLRQSSLALFLSEYEAEGIGAVEARAVGTRTIVTADSALLELVDEKAVLGIAPGARTGDLASKVISCLSEEPDPDDPDGRRMRRSWSDVTTELEAAYEQALGG